MIRIPVQVGREPPLVTRLGPALRRQRRQPAPEAHPATGELERDRLVRLAGDPQLPASAQRILGQLLQILVQTLRMKRPPGPETTAARAAY
ncbi:hypothetical protein GCM10025331_42780 [Actinoplanes utahensis]|uniref:Uncharacterized protein n=1 Tax=Actinoplanes utahensis TaxID=1869 RepID=A0A0A6URA9_ACTUT|nr:hypothetical protein [Actinoplanes utahensis]KHD76944.1 hypothetical protein MB27_14185 [Actinoplanes utahensis]